MRSFTNFTRYFVALDVYFFVGRGGDPKPTTCSSFEGLGVPKIGGDASTMVPKNPNIFP